MKDEINQGRSDLVKRHARKLKKALGVTHHEALDKAAVAAGYSNWAHCVNSTRHPAVMLASPVSRRLKGSGVIPPGTLVRLKPRRSVGMVYASNGSTVEFYDQWGPITAAHEEVSICRDQAPASDFRPLRLFLPYGKWTCEDGSQVLFNRDYCPLWKKASDGTVLPMDPNTWVEHDDEKEEWFYTDGNRPVNSRNSLNACLGVLREWGVENSRPKLLDLLPIAIRAGNMNLLKGYRYNREAAV